MSKPNSAINTLYSSLIPINHKYIVCKEFALGRFFNPFNSASFVVSINVNRYEENNTYNFYLLNLVLI